MRHVMLLCAVLEISYAVCAVALAESGVQQPALTYVAGDSPSDQPANADSTEADQAACGCDTCGCDPCCRGGLLDCCLGDVWTLKDELTPCAGINYGGWFQTGYHSDPTRLSIDFNDGLAFNDVPDHFNLHQAWFYVEKVAEADACSADWGFRFDILYGTDAQKTQAFGNEHNTWDVSFDNGYYGWAMPQLYGEVAYGDWSVKIGHFFTLVGYEVVPAPGNFFYSHSLTMFNSEPFTHTGVLAGYTVSDELTLHAGWTLGWDTGFDQFDGGNSLHAGFISQVTDDVKCSYMCTAGNLGWRSPDGDGYSHSLVFDVALTDDLNYVLQSDYLNADVHADYDRADVGVDQYLFYTVNDCLAVGSRVEWWKSNGVVGHVVTQIGESISFYEATFGLHYKPHANVVVRPEIRYDWTPAANLVNAAAGVPYDQWVFGIDAIVTY